MFSNKESLYINAIKYDTQLKLDYKRLNADKLVKAENYVHLVDDEILAKDIAHKVNLSQEQYPITYLSTLLINDTAYLIPKNKQANLDHEICEFNEEYNIAIAKTTLFETKHYFNKTGIDFIYSAFHILNLHLEQNICKNELLVFLFNNKAFILVLDKNSSIVFSKSIVLPSFENIKDSKFYEDDILGQRLYDEIYYLELSEIIEDTLKEFYSEGKNVFVEKISILYAIKQLEKEQIDSLKEELLLDIEYHPINIDEEIFELSKDKHQKKSFIRPRKKDKTSNSFLIGVIFVLLVLLAGLFYQIFANNEDEVIMESKDNKTLTIKSNKLPDHININDKVSKRVKKLLNAIPYDVILEGFNLYENSAKIDVSLLKEDTFIKSLEPELKELFENSSISLKDKDKKIGLSGVILANTNVKSNIEYKTGNVKYIMDEFLPKNRVGEQLKILFPQDTILKLKKSRNTKYSIYEYYVNMIVKDPNEFFEIVETLNNELYSIHLAYPIIMTKSNENIEIEFTLVFNQINN